MAQEQDKDAAKISAREKRKNAWKHLPDVWALIKPRRSLLAAGFVLMAVNRISGLVLPASTKYFVDNVINAKTGTIRGRAIFDNKDGFLTPGFFGRLRLYGGQRDAFLIPDNVISSDQASKIVFTVADDGTVGTKKVELGPIVDGLRVVRSGLAPTDRIVIDGIQRARPGQKVTAEDGKIEAAAK